MEDLLKQYTENYFNKVEVGYRLPPELKLEEFWEKLLAYRKQNAKVVPLKDQKENNFWYVMPNSLFKKLHEIDSYGRDSLYSMVKKEIENELIRESLIEEAFYSSVIEGAFSTLKRARELVAKKDTPKNNSEQMILNNFNSMRFILENQQREFSHELILELHKITTDKTLEDQHYAGRYRDDWVYITDTQGQIVYTPPAADKIPEAMQRLIDWIRIEKEEEFIHPIIKAAILHFYFVYLHPFFDGNGRTARALFYFYLIKNQYDFFKYFSISAIVNKNRGKYYKAIKDVEDYDSDLTYFLVYMVEAILRAIAEVKSKIAEHYQRDFYLARIREEKVPLNSRQEKLMRKVFLWKEKEIEIKKYQEVFGVVYQTARADLLDLVEKNLLKKTKKGKKFVFTLNFEF